MFKEISSLLRATPAVQTKFAGDAGMFEGYASLFGGDPDSYGDIVEPGAFGNSLDKYAAEKSMPPMLWSHDPSAPIGKWLEIKQDSKGLAVVGQLNLNSDRGRQAHAHLKEGDISGLSIRIANRAGADLVRYSSEFGLTPSSRIRIGVSNSAESDDEADAFF